jgi:deoxyribodipyrimidine photo-lyase
LEHGDRVVPVYILDENWPALPKENQMRTAFLLGGLHRLDADLRNRGSRLIVRRGDAKEELSALLAETGASAIFAEAEYSPPAMGRDAEVEEVLPLRLFDGLTVHPPDALKRGNGEPYTAFSPFSKAWQDLPLPPVRDVLRPPARLAPPPEIASLPLSGESDLLSMSPFAPGEAEAQRRLQAFVDGRADDEQQCAAPIYCYDALRNRLDADSTAQLSPYLSFGMLSARQAVVSALSAMDAASNPEAGYSAELWLKALIRREFAISILYHFPQALDHGLRVEARNMPWENDPAAFDAWKAGRTGFPLVDAAMRQLVQTGWLPNRARMAVASFLVRDLLVDWRWGEQFFLKHLLDGDLAANNLNWQRAAGSGTGPSAYLGILNPVLEGRRYDPDGVYVRRWMPELAGVPARYIHQPWTMPPEVQRESGCVIGQDYPPPILDHGWARDRALDFFGRTRQPVVLS